MLFLVFKGLLTFTAVQWPQSTEVTSCSLLSSVLSHSLCHLLLFSVSKDEKTPLQAYTVCAGILRRIGIQCLYNIPTSRLKPSRFAEISLSSVGGLSYALIKSERIYNTWNESYINCDDARQPFIQRIMNPRGKLQAPTSAIERRSEEKRAVIIKHKRGWMSLQMSLHLQLAEFKV